MQWFGRYVLLEKIAQGGMAEVFRAAAVGTAGFAKPVAIKRILPHLAAEPASVTMLIDEAKIAATLNHPNVLQVLDLGEQDGTLFIAMEFVVGRSLNVVLRNTLKAGQRLPMEQAVFTVSQALQGLAHAHEKCDERGQNLGIIHRDISPQNIMVGFDGSVKLADFGIARAAGRLTRTATGVVKGKVAYMAPEQVLGNQIDQRLDLYAMGVVLYECLIMRRLRGTQTDSELVMAVAKGEYPRFPEGSVPPAVAQVVYRALEPRADDRWPDARSFAGALDAAAREQGWHATARDLSRSMHAVFAQDVEEERQAQARYALQLRELPGDTQLGNPITLVTDADVLVTPGPGTPGSGTQLMTGAGPALVAPTAARVTPSTVAVSAPAAARGVGALVVAAALAVTVGGAAVYALTRPPAAPVQALAGPLVVQTDPPGAAVIINGIAHPGLSPTVVSDLAAGTVEVEARLPGMRPVKDVVVLQAGTPRTVKLVLDPAEKRLEVRSTPPGATVLVNGMAQGKAPLVVTLRGPQDVPVVVQLEGYRAEERRLSAVTAPETLELTLAKIPAALAPSGESGARPKPAPRRAVDTEEAVEEPVGPKGKLTVTSTPWASVEIDGEKLGKFTPLVEWPLPAGRHLVRLVNPDDKMSAVFTVDVAPGQVTTVNKELSKR